MAKKQAAAKRTTTRRAESGRRTATQRTRKTASDRDRSATPTRRAASTDDEAPQPERTESSALTATAEAIGRAHAQTTAAISSRLPWSGKDDGLDLLERDHRRLEALLEDGTNTTEEATDERKALLRTIVQELTIHELIEEKILYPVLKSHAEARDIVLEGYQEHHVADLVVKELQQLPPSDERWGAKLKVLKENIEHHIKEEEGEMFKTARSVLGREQLEEIGAQMQALREEALKEKTSPKSR
jgi:hemerythrin-like domain-containing protein